MKLHVGAYVFGCIVKNYYKKFLQQALWKAEKKKQTTE